MNKFFLTNQSNSFRKWSLVFSLALAILSLYFIPENNMDLSVYYHIIDNIGVFTGLEKFSYVFSRGEYITMIYFWIMSLFKNRHLVQFIPVFLIYFLSLDSFRLIISNNVKSINRSKIILLLLAIFFYISNLQYLFVVSSFRFWLAFTVFAYLVTIKNYGSVTRSKKYINYLIYLLPILIHNSMLIYVGIYHLSSFDFKKNTSKFCVFLMVLIFLYYPINYFFSSNIDPYSTSLLEIYLYKYLLYFAPSIHLNNQTFYRFIQFSLSIVVSLMILSRQKSDSTKFDVYKSDQIFSFFIYLQVFAIFTLIFNDIFFRNIEVIRMFATLIILKDIVSVDNNSEKNNTLTSFFVFLIIIGLVLQYSTFVKAILPNLYL